LTTASTGSGRTVLAPPAKGQIDQFTWALPFEPTSLDPIKSWNYPENTILANLCESVVHLTPDLRLEPGLASTRPGMDAPLTTRLTEPASSTRIGR
jgi:hypothetical protein